MRNSQTSLSSNLKARSFVAANGELGLHLTDVPNYIEACQADGIHVLGWEAWIINHLVTGEFSQGAWTGLIPMLDGSSATIGGEGDADEVKRQCANFRPEAEVAPRWLPHVRVNIAIASE